MESDPNAPRKVEFYYVNNQGWDKLDPEMAAWVKTYMQAFINQLDSFEFGDSGHTPSVQSELAELERLDAEVAPDASCAQALSWILNARG